MPFHLSHCPFSFHLNCVQDATSVYMLVDLDYISSKSVDLRSHDPIYLVSMVVHSYLTCTIFMTKLLQWYYAVTFILTDFNVNCSLCKEPQLSCFEMLDFASTKKPSNSLLSVCLLHSTIKIPQHVTLTSLLFSKE